MFCDKCGIELADDATFCQNCGAMTIFRKKKERGTSEVKNIRFSSELNQLRILIGEIKQSVLAIGINQHIIKLLERTVDSAETAILLIRNYQVLFKGDLIEDLKDLSNNYDNIKTYLSQFIELNVVEATFPHKIIISKGKKLKVVKKLQNINIRQVTNT